MNLKPVMRGLLLCYLGLLSSLTPIVGQGFCFWTPATSSGTGVENQAANLAIAGFDDGTGFALYVGGHLAVAGGHIAKWSGNSWSPLGSGVSGVLSTAYATYVNMLRTFDDGTGPSLFVAGTFTMAGGQPAPSGLAKWTGSSWESPGSALPLADVEDLKTFDDSGVTALYAAGIGGVAMLSGGNWQYIGPTNPGGKVESLLVLDAGTGPALYASGNFSSIAGLPAPGYARWQGGSWSTWSILGPGPGGPATRLAVFDDGSGPAVYRIDDDALLRWNGSSWYTVLYLGGYGNYRDGLIVFDDGTGPALYWETYYFGYFSESNAGQVERWDGTNVSPLGDLAHHGPQSLTVIDDGTGPTLYAALWDWTAYSWGYPGRWTCPSTITLTSTQPGGAGSRTYLANSNLTPQREYYNVFSLDMCSGGPGTGSLFGLCLTTMPNYTFIMDQLQAPLGTPLFHFLAQDSYTIWGGYQIPPMTVDGIVFDFTGGVIGPFSPVTRIVIQ